MNESRLTDDRARLVLVCGSGGVGKTSTAAAIAVARAHEGKRVLVVTVDPARRLAQALGVQESGNEIVDASSILRPDTTGSLFATMLDTKAGWDELVRRHAPDSRVAERVLANELYHNITARFVNSHDYIAMERLFELSSDDRFDTVIVDTPPSRNALSLLDAPRRMKEFFGSRLLKWLTVPYRSRVVSLASRPFFAIADRVLGARFLSDIVDFFTLMRTMEGGFVERAVQVEKLLESSATTFVVVTNGEEVPAQEAQYLLDELERRSMRVDAVVLNRLQPAIFSQSIEPSLLHDIAETVHSQSAEFERSLSAMVRKSAALATRQAAVVERLRSGNHNLVQVPFVALRSETSVILGISTAFQSR